MITNRATTIIFRILQVSIPILGIINVFYQMSNERFGNYNFFIGFTLIMLNSLLIIVIHEFGHVFYLLLKKIPIRSIYLPFLSIHFGLKTKFRIETRWIGEGLVIPDFPIINKESEFRKLKKTYAEFLIAGPIATIIYCGIMIPVLLNIKYLYIENYGKILLLHTCLQTFFLMNNCFKISEKSIGDIVALDKIKNDNFFVASYVFCCYFFSEDYKTKIEGCKYVKDVIMGKLAIMSDDELVCESAVLDEIIYRTISGLDDYFKEFLDQRIHSLLDSLLDNLLDKGQCNCNVISTYIHALMYISIICNKKNEALNLYAQIEGLLQQQNDRSTDYLLSQIKYLLCLEAGKPKDIYPITEFERWNFYRQYYDCENAILATKH